MTQLEATSAMRAQLKAHMGATPPLIGTGLALVEELMQFTLEHDPQSASALAQEIVANPQVAEATIAMAIGALCQVEVSLQSAAKTLAGLEADSPDAVQAIKEQVSQRFGIPVEDVDLR